MHAHTSLTQKVMRPSGTLFRRPDFLTLAAGSFFSSMTMMYFE